MHITELTQELIAKLKEHVEVNPEGQILTKKSRLFYRQQPEDHAVKQFAGKIVRLGDTRTKLVTEEGQKPNMVRVLHSFFQKPKKV